MAEISLESRLHEAGHQAVSINEAKLYGNWTRLQGDIRPQKASGLLLCRRWTKSAMPTPVPSLYLLERTKSLLPSRGCQGDREITGVTVQQQVPYR